MHHPEKHGAPHKQRLCDGLYIFKNIFKKFSSFFILFFILCIFLHIIYVQENVRRIRRRTLFPLYFLYSVVETAAALQALFPGLWLSHFLWRKKKKKKKKEWRGSVSKKKRDIFRAFNLCFWVVAALNVILVKQDYQNDLPEIFGRKCVGSITGSS